MEVAHPLDSIKAKIERADKTLHDLNGEIVAFIRAHSDPYRIVREFRNQGKDYVFIAFGELAVPLRFSVLAGEILYHLRSSLDHLVWKLVEEEGGTPTRANQFPICATAEKFAKTCSQGYVKGVSDSAKRLIESVQPYATPNPSTSVLAVIEEWCNTDKHRLLLVVSGAARLGDRLEVAGDEPVEITGFSPPVLRKVTNDGVELFRINLAMPSGH